MDEQILAVIKRKRYYYVGSGFQYFRNCLLAYWNVLQLLRNKRTGWGADNIMLKKCFSKPFLPLTEINALWGSSQSLQGLFRWLTGLHDATLLPLYVFRPRQWTSFGFSLGANCAYLLSPLSQKRNWWGSSRSYCNLLMLQYRRLYTCMDLWQR